MNKLLMPPRASTWKSSVLRAAFASLSIQTLLAQVATPPATESQPAKVAEVVVLSPFQVDATRDTGYIANRSMTGSRLNTELRDTPASITVFTQDMLRDLNVTNAQEAMDYAPNVEFTESTAGIADISLFKMRVRGFANAGAGGTQDFFEIYDDLDAYKLDQLGFARGPNGVLFGIGDPGGKITAIPKRGHFLGNAYEVGTRFDSWGGWRVTADVNHILVPKRAALRVALVNQDQREGTRELFRKDRRIYLAATFELIDRHNFKTTLRGNYEKIDGDDAVGHVQILNGQLATWVNAGRPLGTTAATTPGTTAFPAASLTSSRLTYIGGAGSPALPIMDWSGKLQSNGPTGAAVGTGTLILDETLFPYDRNPRGSRNVAWRAIDASTVFLEQQIGQDLFFEAAALRTTAERRSIGATSSFLARGDPNPTLPNGSPNPNARKLYIEYTGNHTDRYSWRNTYRFSGSYQFNFARFGESLGHWLGRHQLFGAYEYNTNSQALERLLIVNDTPLPGVTLNRNAAANQVWLRSYVDPAADSYGYDVDFTNLTPGNGVTPRLLPVSGQDRNRTDAEANIYALQSHLWKDRIIGTLGWRVDNIETFNGLGESLRDPVTGILPYARDQEAFFASEAEFKPTSKGVVVRPIDWIGLHYNEAENFSTASPSQVTLFNEPIPARGGVGKDYGVRVDLLKDKLTATLNLYEASGINAIQNQTIANDINQIWITLGRPERTAGDPNVRDLQDEVSKGWEFSLFYNPTRNWRIFFSFTKNNTVVSNVHPNWLAYSALHLATWQAAAAMPLAGGTGTVGDAIGRILSFENNALANEGITAFNQRTYNGSLTTNYEFTGGLFKNASIGGAVLYRGDAISGYPTVGGVPQLDQPFEEPGYYIVNLNLGYNHKLRGKWLLRTRFTIENITDRDGRIIVTQRAPTAVTGAAVGSPIKGRWIEGTNATLSFSVGF